MITTNEIASLQDRFNWSPEDTKLVTMMAIQNYEWATNDAAQKATLRALMIAVKKVNMMVPDKGEDKVTFTVKVEKHDGQVSFSSPRNIYRDANILVSLEKSATNKDFYDGEIILKEFLGKQETRLSTIHKKLLELRKEVDDESA